MIPTKPITKIIQYDTRYPDEETVYEIGSDGKIIIPVQKNTQHELLNNEKPIVYDWDDHITWDDDFFCL